MMQVIKQTEKMGKTYQAAQIVKENFPSFFIVGNGNAVKNLARHYNLANWRVCSYRQVIGGKLKQFESRFPIRLVIDDIDEIPTELLVEFYTAIENYTILAVTKSESV
jgi:hypothetical protein